MGFTRLIASGNNNQMKYWLLKTEPQDWSWQQQVKSGNAEWNGVRNFQAAKNLKSMKINDKCFFITPVKKKKLLELLKLQKKHFQINPIKPKSLYRSWSKQLLLLKKR